MMAPSLRRLALCLAAGLSLLPVHTAAQQQMDSTGHAVRHPKDSTYFNAIKWNLAGISFNNISLLYERTLNQRWSVQLGASYKYGGDFPEFLGLTRVVMETEHGGLTGFSVTPEGRYYFQNKRYGERLGLYAGIYGRVTQYQGKVTFLYWDGSEYIDIGGAGDMWEYGLGLQLGYQLNLGRHWLVDLMFMGPRTSFHSLKLELDSDFVEEVIPIIEEELNERLAWWGMDPVDLPDESTVKVNFRFNNFRYYVGIGYRF